MNKDKIFSNIYKVVDINGNEKELKIDKNYIIEMIKETNLEMAEFMDKCIKECE